MSQLVFIAKDGKVLRLPFRSGRWTVERIRDALEQNGVAANEIIVVGNTDAEHVEMKVLTDALLPDGTDRDVAQLADGVEIQGEMKAQISEEYLRAIAKVGFHFFLQFFPAFSGLEPEFDDIKQFIYKGKCERRIVATVDQPFLKYLQQPGVRLRKWCHLISAESRESGIEARVQFFAGPEVEPLVWSIIISTKPSAHVQFTGSAFVYFDDVTEEYQGERIDLHAE
jgi:hypothetical protein